MRLVEFRRYLADDNALRVRFELEHGRVVGFTIQLECRLGDDDEWVPVVRYDTAHGFAHCDRLHPYDPAVKTEMTSRSYNEALTLAMDDLANNWESYRRRYEEWLRQR
jgi:hypothetical protein